MRLSTSLAGLAALTGSVYCQFEEPPADSVIWPDAKSGFTFSSFRNEFGIEYHIALPDTDKTPYDAVIQIVAPLETGWTGMAWGGTMTYNPLTIVWKNEDTVVVSSRMAFGYYVPSNYEDASYTILEGTGVNDTHWFVTALCSGCTSWQNIYDDEITSLDSTAQNTLAFAFSTVPPDEPASNTSIFGIHELTGHWIHDFKDARQKDFDALVAKNMPAAGKPAERRMRRGVRN